MPSHGHLKPEKQLPIGVFDSGMGGLTVLRELKNRLPQESFIYLGDTARLPYGTKSPATVICYANQAAEILFQQNIKLLVVACNTASTAALDNLQQRFPHHPIIGVVEPGAQAAVAATKNNKVVVLATETTVNSGAYQAKITHLNPKIKVTAQSCGLFVALAEEGCINDEVTAAAVKKYLLPIMNHSEKKDCVVLGCTHFPVLKQSLRKLLGDDVSIVDSAAATAEVVATQLKQHNLLNNSPNPSQISFLVTDLPERFIRVGQIFFGEPIDEASVHLVDGLESRLKKF